MPETIDSATVSAARRRLRRIVLRVYLAVATSGREAAIELLCSSLDTIPVPVLSHALSNAARSLLQRGDGKSGEHLRDVLARLRSMSRSNERFESGLSRLGQDVAAIATDVQEVKSILVAQTTPLLAFRGVAVKLSWPAYDNRVSGLVANAGGGTLYVHEVFVEVESWRPLIALNYTLSGAPLPDLHLKAELRTDTSSYPLLSLNGQPERQLNERGAGSERVTIDFASPENVEFSVRLRLAYSTLDGESADLVYPPLGDPPLALPFACAPGWRRVDVSKLQQRDAVYDGLRSTLIAVTDALRDNANPDEAFEDSDWYSLLGELPLDFLWPTFATNFAPLLIEVARADERPSARQVATALLEAVQAKTGEPNMIELPPP